MESGHSGQNLSPYLVDLVAALRDPIVSVAGIHFGIRAAQSLRTRGRLPVEKLGEWQVETGWHQCSIRPLERRQSRSASDHVLTTLLRVVCAACLPEERSQVRAAGMAKCRGAGFRRSRSRFWFLHNNILRCLPISGFRNDRRYRWSDRNCFVLHRAG